ncbi:MAG: ABC transporter permease [Deltaproteobacteria bacterium]|nr:ABC transporter permease [Deltaproteobacteria bacterium]
MSKLGLAVYIALKIARSKRSATLSIVTLISVIGIACGVMALTVVLAVTDGFQAAFQEKILGIFPHLVVSRTSSIFRDYEPVLTTIRATEGVVGATPITGDEMMVAHGVFRAGATVQGVDLPSVESVLDVKSLLRSGRLEDLSEEPTVSREAAAGAPGWRITDPVEGVSLTLVALDDGPPRVLVDDRVAPDPGRARLKLLDLRAGAPGLTLEPRSSMPPDLQPPPGEDDNGLPGMRKKTPKAVDDEPLSPVNLGARPDGYGAEIEIAAGEWQLGAAGERLALEAGNAYTIVAWSGGALFMVEPGKAIHGEREALVRVVDARAPGAAPLGWYGGRSPTPIATTTPGQHSGMTPVAARIPGVLLGAALADKLRAKVGDELTFVTPLRGIDNKMMGPFGMLPSSAHFRVVGTFEAGFYDHDVRLAIVNIEVSQRFLNRGRMVRSLAVKTRSLLDIDVTKGRLQRALDPYPLEDFLASSAELQDKLDQLVRPGADPRIQVPTPDSPFLGHLRNVTVATSLLKYHGQDTTRRARFQIFDWKEKNINLFSALELQKVVLSIFFFIIILVGSFVVVGSQIMVVHEKTPDIAILKAMGATSGLVRLVFTLQGLLVALIGLGVGLVLGVGLTALIEAVDYQLEASIYLIDHLPAKLEPVELALVAVGALVCTLVTTQISAGKAANKTIVAGLRQVD